MRVVRVDPAMPFLVNCAQCAASFLAMRSRKYCNPRCAKAAARVRSAVARGRFKVDTATRLRVYARDGNRCHLCGHLVRLMWDATHPWSATLDHLVPRSRGGSDRKDNLATAHRWCNTLRGDADVSATAYAAPPEAWDLELFRSARTAHAA